MRVDFYLLTHNINAQHFVCRIASKAYDQSLRTGIWVESTQYADQLNELLWTFQQNSFIPHHYLQNGNCHSVEDPVLIFNTLPDDIDSLDILINCSLQMPTYSKPSGRIAEIIADDNHAKQCGRERYSEYKQRDCELQHHEITR